MDVVTGFAAFAAHLDWLDKLQLSNLVSALLLYEAQHLPDDAAGMEQELMGVLTGPPQPRHPRGAHARRVLRPRVQ